MKNLKPYILIIIVIIITTTPSFSVCKERLAVMDLVAVGVEKDLAEVISVAVRDEIQSFGKYEVLSRYDTKALLSNEIIKQASWICADKQCLIDLLKPLQIDLIIYGSISKQKFSKTYNYNIDLSLLNTKGDETEFKRREQVKCSENELFDIVVKLSAFLLGRPPFIPVAEGKPFGLDKRKFTLVQTVTSATGRVWMDRNLGASRVATSLTDSEAYGDFYQWGRETDGHEKCINGITFFKSFTNTPGHDKFITVINRPHDWRYSQNNKLWQGVPGPNNPCPTGFRLPTDKEWEIEISSWSSQDSIGAYMSPLKLVAAGYYSLRLPNCNERTNLGSSGHYWSSTVHDDKYSGFLCFKNDWAAVGKSYRMFGRNVRCIKE
jgi:uncharacterized protein (TIGR02145 family)